MAEAYIIDAVRTPRGIGKPGKGALSHLHPQHLAATVLKAIAERNHLDTGTVDDIIWSTSSQVDKQGGEPRRVTFAPGFDGFPQFSPDGQYLVWASNRANPSGRETNLFIARWVD